MSPRLFTKTALIAVLAMTVALTAGCAGSPQEVADTSGWFHVQVPAKWQATVQDNSIYIVASNKLPEAGTDAFANLSMQIYASDTATGTDVAKELTALVDGRAKSRGWTAVKLSKPAKVQIGKRDAYAVDISAKDSKKRDFAGRVALVHTNGREALVVALAPADVWAKSGDKIVKNLYTNWFWHEPASKDASGTPQP